MSEDSRHLENRPEGDDCERVATVQVGDIFRPIRSPGNNPWAPCPTTLDLANSNLIEHLAGAATGTKGACTYIVERSAYNRDFNRARTANQALVQLCLPPTQMS
ncbi:hypothetical protein GCM10007863_37200 [Dyella mobilis]|nr:hypothetical protein GCM10007863_37200 [Dyella mobilis]